MKLLIDGNFNDEEIKQLQSLLDIEIFRYQKRSFDERSYIQLIFQGFTVTTFLRDWLLGNLLNVTIRKATSWLKINRPKLQAHISFHLTDQEKQLSMNISIPVENMNDMVSKLIDEIPKLQVKSDNQKMVNIGWDSEKDDLKIIEF